MLNNKGIYYAKLIVRGIDELKDKLINGNLLFNPRSEIIIKTNQNFFINGIIATTNKNGTTTI